MSSALLDDAGRALAREFGRRHGVLLGSGTAALFCAFEALRLSHPRVESPTILFPNTTCETAVNAAVFADLAPRFCDVNADDLLMAARSAKELAQDAHVIGVVPTHIFGHLLDVDALQAQLGRPLAIIEDAAQGYGGSLQGRKAGSMGLASVLSFGAGKLLECGGGGALLCDDESLAQVCRDIAATLPANDQHVGELRRSVMQQMLTARKAAGGDRSRLIAQQMQVLRQHRNAYLAQCTPTLATQILARLPQLHSAVQARASLTAELDAILGGAAQIRLPPRSGNPALWRYTFMTDAAVRDSLVNQLALAGLEVSKLFKPCSEKFSAPRPLLSNSDRLASEVVNLQFPSNLADRALFVESVKRAFIL